jgi:periplasmic divalent cation tolerance protein
MALISGTGEVIVQTNCASAEEARAIARAAVEAGLAACGNVHGPIASVYRWEGEIVEAPEHVLVLKTVRDRLDALEALIRAHHSYVTPAFLVLPIAAGEAGYLAWIAAESVGTPGTKTALVQKDSG